MKNDEFVHHLHPFLSGMTPAHVSLLSENATEVHFAAGDLVFREAANADRFYLIQRGEVALQTHSAGKVVTIQTIHDGDVLGWAWLFPPYRWHFDARALKDTDAIFIYAPRLRERIEGDPALGYELMKRVAQVVIHRLHATRLKVAQTQTSLAHSGLPGIG